MNKQMEKVKEEIDMAQEVVTMFEEYTENDNIASEVDADNAKSESASETDVPVVTTSMMSDYLKLISNFRVLSATEEVELFKRFEAGDREAYETIYNHNLRLVLSIAKHYFDVASGIDQIDLIMEGNIGLAIAIRRFDYKTGYKFSTYGSWWIRQSIIKAICNQNKMIRIPVHQIEKINTYQKYINTFKADGESIPSAKEIAKNLNITEEQVVQTQNIIYHLGNYTSLNMPTSDEADSLEMMDFIPASVNIEGECINSDLRDSLLKMIDRWAGTKNNKDRNRDIVIRRFGLNTGIPETLEEIGADYGVSRERVRQVESSFIKFARNPKNKRVLSGYLD